MGIDYSKESKEFNDPIVRCCDCQHLVHRLYIAKRGGCHHCGNRRFKNVLMIRPEELRGIHNGTIDFALEKERWHPIDADFLACFKEVEDA